MNKEQIAALLELRDRMLESLEQSETTIRGAANKVRELEQAINRVNKLHNQMSESALAEAKERASDMHQLFARNFSALTTIEMVVYTLWKAGAPAQKVGEIATKLVRLLGHGPDYFHDRRDWDIDRWVRHLVTVGEEDMPK